MRRELRRDLRRELIPVDRKRAPRWQLVVLCGLQDERAGAAHLLVQEADRVVFPVVGPEGVGADEFGAVPGFVGLGQARWPHLVQYDIGSALSGLPCCLGPRKASPYHVKCAFCCHGRKVGENARALNAKPCTSVGSYRQSLDFFAADC